jgi:hypothetical protein
MLKSKFFSVRFICQVREGTRNLQGREHSSIGHLEAVHRMIPGPRIPGDYILRGSKADLIGICPKYPNSIAPIIFHLPNRTIDRILESIRPEYIGPLFVESGSTCFGTDSIALRRQLPRWRSSRDIEKAKKYLRQLGHLVICKSHSVPTPLLSEVIRITGILSESKFLSGQVSNEIIRAILPICLDKQSLSRKDVYNIVYGVNRIPITRENAILFPVISNFAHWYMWRARVNSSKRRHQKQIKDSIGKFISS